MGDLLAELLTTNTPESDQQSTRQNNELTQVNQTTQPKTDNEDTPHKDINNGSVWAQLHPTGNRTDEAPEDEIVTDFYQISNPIEVSNNNSVLVNEEEEQEEESLVLTLNPKIIQSA